MSYERVFLGYEEIHARLIELSDAYLKESYDFLFYVPRGGMVPSSVISHRLGLMAESTVPLKLSSRHADDCTDSELQVPELMQDISADVEGRPTLLVEDTIGHGVTLDVALNALLERKPASVDILSVGLNHKNFLLGEFRARQDVVSDIAVGFDYWGWMVFPWETDAQPLRQEPPGKKPFKMPWQNELNSLQGKPLQIGMGAASQCLDGCEYVPYGAAHNPADTYIVTDCIPSQIGLAAWRKMVSGLQSRPGTRLVFDYLDRREIAAKEDLRPDPAGRQGVELYTPGLMRRLMQKAGYEEQHSAKGFGDYIKVC
ncbi:MAG: phosphoribosyltransferase family protein [archaeon]